MDLRGVIIGKAMPSIDEILRPDVHPQYPRALSHLSLQMLWARYLAARHGKRLFYIAWFFLYTHIAVGMEARHCLLGISIFTLAYIPQIFILLLPLLDRRYI
jgi:hypothetical protein